MTLSSAPTDSSAQADDLAALMRRMGQAAREAACALAVAGSGAKTRGFTARVMLDPRRIAGTAGGRKGGAGSPDPGGGVTEEGTRPTGLPIQRGRAPPGVMGITYEARPKVPADAGGLALKSGNAAIL